MTSGGGFEDALYTELATPAGRVHGAPAVLSSVQGGNGTLAWEPLPGVVAYVGWSGAPVSAEAVTALRTLAGRAHTNPQSVAGHQNGADRARERPSELRTRTALL